MVLILGESGVGKELVAGALQYGSERAEKPLIKFNCAIIPENLTESQLFGHAKGAFIGAMAQHMGYFEQAHGATILLDQVGDLISTVHAKLPSVPQDRTIDRINGRGPIRIDVRIIAATKRVLAQRDSEGPFRKDLFCRPNVVPITVPPLRRRDNDVILLADQFVASRIPACGKDMKMISTTARGILTGCRAPGTLREREDMIERALTLKDDDLIAGNLRPSQQTPTACSDGRSLGLDEKPGAIDFELIVDALKANTTLSQPRRSPRTDPPCARYPAAKARHRLPRFQDGPAVFTMTGGWASAPDPHLPARRGPAAPSSFRAGRIFRRHRRNPVRSADVPRAGTGGRLRRTATGGAAGRGKRRHPARLTCRP